MDYRLKKPRPKSIGYMMLLSIMGAFVAPSSAQSGNDSTVVVTVSGRVIAPCSIEVKNSDINLPPVELEENQKPGALIPGVMPAKIDVTSKCTGAEKIKYSLVPVSGTDGSCLAPVEGGVIQLCLFNGEKRLDFTGGQVATITDQKNGELSLDIKPAYGTKPKTGEYSAWLTIKVEPM